MKEKDGRYSIWKGTQVSELVKTDAIISECEKYRYELSRIWDESKDLCAFIMLNPSTADASEDDPTIRRDMGFARSWGFGGIVVFNLFAFRATSPGDLKKAGRPFGQENYNYLLKAIKYPQVIAAWGTQAVAVDPNLVEDWTNRLKKAGNCFHLGLTRGGHPKHPLYLRSDTERTQWTI